MTEWLFGTFLATSLLMAIVLVVRAPVARVFGAPIAYALWLIPAARLVMPSISRIVELPAAPVESGAIAGQIETAIDTSVQAGVDWTAIALIVWLVGAMLLFFWRIVAHIRECDDILEDAKPLDDIGDIALIEAPLASGPVAFGLWKKYIAVPPGFSKDYSDAERELVLKHELAHHQSRDLAANFIAFLFLCLHWFNPVAWFAWRAFRFDQEAACDARVLAAGKDCDRETYGRAIAKAASGQPMVFATALNNRKSLKKRLEMMKNLKISKRGRIAGSAAIGAGLAVALPMTATVSYAYVQDDAEAREVITDIEITRDGTGGDAGQVRHIDIERTHRDTAGEDDADGERRVERRVILHHGADGEMPTREEINAMIPEINIEERCGNGAGANVDHESEDGRHRIRMVICGEGEAAEARASALAGLREARAEIVSDSEMPGSVRTDVLARLDEEIARLSN